MGYVEARLCDLRNKPALKSVSPVKREIVSKWRAFGKRKLSWSHCHPNVWTNQMFFANGFRDGDIRRDGLIAAAADIALAKPSIERRAVSGQVFASILHYIDGLLTPYNPKGRAESR